MGKSTIYRPCPVCLPGSNGDFDFEGIEGDARVYACRNCGHEVMVTPRKQKKGSPSQLRTIQRIRDTLGEGYEIEEQQYEWEFRPVCHLILKGSKWFQRPVFVTVGPRGALEKVRVPGIKVEESGPKAWSTIYAYTR
jgi:DNA-directed RNA polymerase subunit RPC12/RpoP